MIPFTELPDSEQKEWSETMLGYSYDLAEWIEARDTLTGLLQKDAKNAKETTVRSYLACCAEAMSGISPPPNLAVSVEEFYRLYGMEEAGPG